ncbi:MAG: flagellin FliC [Actinomycetota bacterium]|nr:flagellin FliC [Actinomycetota bacterium]
MGLRINNNAAAMTAYRSLSASDSQMSKSLEKLSSGFRINRAADDAAGLVISESLRGQVNGLKVATRNAQDAVSMVQTTEGALTEVHSMLQRMRDLAVQASNGTNSAESIAAASAEAKQLTEQIDKIASNTQFNGIKLLNGTAGTAGAVTFQVGANADEELGVTLKNMGTGTGGALTDVAVTNVTWTTAAEAEAAITKIDSAIKAVSTHRGDLGAVQNRLEHTINNLSVTSENLAASESRIRDTDMAKEMTAFTKNQVLVQAGTAMLAQANSSSQNVLSLLRG